MRRYSANHCWALDQNPCDPDPDLPKALNNLRYYMNLRSAALNARDLEQLFSFALILSRFDHNESTTLSGATDP